MKRMSGATIAATAAISAALLAGVMTTSASATATAHAVGRSTVHNASTPTEYCFYTPRGSVSHYFSLASGTRVVKGEYTHGQQFTVGLPPTTDGLDGITYWKLPNGYWIDSAGIIRVPGPCETT